MHNASKEAIRRSDYRSSVKGAERESLLSLSQVFFTARWNYQSLHFNNHWEKACTLWSFILFFWI